MIHQINDWRISNGGGVISNIFKKGTAVLDNRPLLQKLVSYVESNSVDKAIPLLSSNGARENPVSIPYTPEVIVNDFIAVRQCMNDNALAGNELAALIATQLLKKHPKSIKSLLAESGYDMPTVDRIIYLNTHTSSISSLREFASMGVKSYRVSGCGDQRMCSKCAMQDGKKHLVSKTVIGKTAPPFCEKCRRVIIAEF